jgi:hypothetical protein
MKTWVLTIMIGPLLCGVGLAQTKPTGERSVALNRLNFLEGRWKWSGWGETGKGREKVEVMSRCEWMSRLMVCRDDPTKPGEWSGIDIYSYNDRKGRYEGAFVDETGQVVAHTLRWEGETLIAEYELYVAGGYHLARRTISATGPDALRWTVQDLGDERIATAIDVTATRLPK